MCWEDILPALQQKKNVCVPLLEDIVTCVQFVESEQLDEAFAERKKVTCQLSTQEVWNLPNLFDSDPLYARIRTKVNPPVSLRQAIHVEEVLFEAFNV